MGSSSRRRLSSSADFDHVFRRGVSASNRYLVLHFFERPESSEQRLGLSVSRKVGGAVVRNRVKRLLREAFRGNEAELQSHGDYVVVARPDLAGLAEQEGLEGVSGALLPLLLQLKPSEEKASK